MYETSRKIPSSLIERKGLVEYLKNLMNTDPDLLRRVLKIQVEEVGGVGADGGGPTRATFASQFKRYEEDSTWAVEGDYLVTRKGKVQEAYEMGWLISLALSQGIRAALSLPIDPYIFKLVINDDVPPLVEDLLARRPQLSPKNFKQLYDDELSWEIDPEMGGSVVELFEGGSNQRVEEEDYQQFLQEATNEVYFHTSDEDEALARGLQENLPRFLLKLLGSANLKVSSNIRDWVRRVASAEVLKQLAWGHLLRFCLCVFNKYNLSPVPGQRGHRLRR